MRRALFVWVSAAAVLTAAGCGGGGGGATPEATFKAYKAAMSDKDFDAVWDMLTAASQQRMKQDAAALAEQATKAEGPGRTALEDQAKLIDVPYEDLKKLDGKGLFTGLLKMASKTGKDEWDKLPRGEISRVEETGERAKVFIKVDGKEQTVVDPKTGSDVPVFLPVLREGGKWKIDMVLVDVGAARTTSPLSTR